MPRGAARLLRSVEREGLARARARAGQLGQGLATAGGPRRGAAEPCCGAAAGGARGGVRAGRGRGLARRRVGGGAAETVERGGSRLVAPGPGGETLPALPVAERCQCLRASPAL